MILPYTQTVTINHLVESIIEKKTRWHSDQLTINAWK